MAYLDDVVICAPRLELPDAMATLEATALSVNLCVNRPKCRALVDVNSPQIPLVGVQAVTDGLVLLGAPIGSAPFVASFVTSRLDAVLGSVRKLTAFRSYNDQARYLFIRHVSCNQR